MDDDLSRTETEELREISRPISRTKNKITRNKIKSREILERFSVLKATLFFHITYLISFCIDFRSEK